MRVTDLAEAIAPGVPTEIIGIRPGEKLHEVLLTADEARHAIDAERRLRRAARASRGGPPSTPWIEGKPLDDDFVYASDTNDWWLTSDELQQRIVA